MPNTNLSKITDQDIALAKQIAKQAGVNLDDCYQCGKCTAGCPMVHAMDYSPRQVIRLLHMGQVQAAINARAPWICANCMVCSARCPQSVNISELMLAIRHYAKKNGLRPVKDGDKFDDAFVANIRSWGKSNEPILAAKYNLKSGHLFQDVNNVPRMIARGMIGPKIHGIKDKQSVKQIFDRVMGGGVA